MEAWNSDSNGEERISPMLELKKFRVCDYKNHSQLKKLVQDESSSLHVLPSEALSTFKMDKQIVTVYDEAADKFMANNSYRRNGMQN